jgi:hypothetical protein
MDSELDYKPNFLKVWLGNILQLVFENFSGALNWGPFLGGFYEKKIFCFNNFPFL